MHDVSRSSVFSLGDSSRAGFVAVCGGNCRACDGTLKCQRVARYTVERNSPLPPRSRENILMLLLRKLVNVRPAGVVVRLCTGFAVLSIRSWPECSITRLLSFSREPHRRLGVSFLFRVGKRDIMLAADDWVDEVDVRGLG
jgi:hypothetical protein